MNLVIDDAVEVKQATKTTEESRRSLGWFMLFGWFKIHANNF
jgi:small nuclear ribonucleoprotein E